MSDIKAGDWVKVTITGKVEDVHSRDGILLQEWDYYLPRGSAVEKVDLAPGSVIRNAASGETLMKMRERPGWVDEKGTVTDRAIDLTPYEVVYDAGKAS